MNTIAIIVLVIIAVSFCIAKTAIATPIPPASVPSVLAISNENSTFIPATTTSAPVAIETASVPEEKYNSSKMAYNAINVPVYIFPNADTLFNQKWQMFSQKDLNKLCKKLNMEDIEWFEDDCFMHSFCYNYGRYNKSNPWFAVHCAWSNYKPYRSALRSTVEIYYFDKEHKPISLFRHDINIVSYRDLRLFIEYALRVKREYMKQTSVT